MDINETYYDENKFYLLIDEIWRDSYYQISLDYILNGFYKIYLYPEKDFCLFKEFHKDKLIKANLFKVELKVNINFKMYYFIIITFKVFKILSLKKSYNSFLIALYFGF